MINNHSFRPPRFNFPDDLERFNSAVKSNDVPLAQELLNEIGSWVIDARDDIDACPMTWAASFGHCEMMEFLLQNGADVNGRGTSEKPPLAWAAERGDEKSVDLLLKNGADITLIDNDGRTAGELAGICGYPGIALRIQNWQQSLQQAEVDAKEEVSRQKEEAVRKAAESRIEALRKLRNTGGPGFRPRPKP